MLLGIHVHSFVSVWDFLFLVFTNKLDTFVSVILKWSFPKANSHVYTCKVHFVHPNRKCVLFLFYFAVCFVHCAPVFSGQILTWAAFLRWRLEPWEFSLPVRVQRCVRAKLLSGPDAPSPTGLTQPPAHPPWLTTVRQHFLRPAEPCKR